MGGSSSGGAWDTLVEGRGRELHARDSSLREGWWGDSGGGTRDAPGNDDDDESGDGGAVRGLASSIVCDTLVEESGGDAVVGGLAGGGACDVFEVEVAEWGGCAS